MLHRLPTFRLEAYFSRWEFAARHHLTASDPQTLTVGELLALGTDEERAAFHDLPLSYVPTWGTDELRAAVASTYGSIASSETLIFAGAEEALFWTMDLLLAPGDHAVVTVPNYQSMESVAIATGADITGLPMWTGTGSELRWTLDLERVEAALRPNTTVVAVNFPNNPTGFVPSVDDFAALVRLCDDRGIRLVSDEVYRGVELAPERTLPNAADLSERAVSLNVLSKAYGLPGLRVGWIACHDRGLLATLEQAKHYTSIANAGPSELLATIALRNGERLRDRIRSIVARNLPAFDAFFTEHAELFDWTPPDGGCVAFPRYQGSEGVEKFCERLVEEFGVLLLPASIYRSELLEVPGDRFRIGVGRADAEPGLDAIRDFLRTRQG